MSLDASTGIAAVGVFGGLLAGAVALFNSRKAVCWKRAELANSYTKDFNGSDELVFAGRCLDWNGGKLGSFPLTISASHLNRRCSEPRPALMCSFPVVSSSSLQPRPISGAVADLGSR